MTKQLTMVVELIMSERLIEFLDKSLYVLKKSTFVVAVKLGIKEESDYPIPTYKVPKYISPPPQEDSPIADPYRYRNTNSSS